jgi:thymidylate kinase
MDSRDEVAGRLGEPRSQRWWDRARAVDRPSVLQAIAEVVIETVDVDGRGTAHSSGHPFGAHIAAPTVATVSLEDLVRRALARLPWTALLVASEPDARHRVAVVAVDLSTRWEVFRISLPPREIRTRSYGPTGTAPGISIAIYGVDGSGKSTLIERLIAALSPVFAGCDRWHLLQFQAPGHVADPVNAPHDQRPRSMATSVGKIIWYLVRAWFVRGPAVARARRRRRLVLLDRDVADTSIDPIRYRYGGPAWLNHAAAALAPRPSIALVLDADADTILERSTEIGRDEIERLLERYRRFAHDRSWATAIDARRSADEVLHEACGVVFTMMASTCLVEGRTSRG